MRLVPHYGEETEGARTVHFSEPEGIRVRAASGLAAADFVLGDYWVWNPIFEALAQAGYDESMMVMMSYDWRLPLRDLEHRDRYFSRMSLEIEKLVALNKEKVFIVTHSFGGKVWFFFLQWASEHLATGWIEKHMHATYHIGAVFLGVPKAVAATLSGDTRDTAQLGALSTLLDTVLPPADRSTLFSGWGSVVDMLPMGGLKSWKSPMLVINGSSLLVEDTVKLLFNTSVMSDHALHRKGDPSKLRCPPNALSSKSCYRDVWTDPSAVALPPTGSMKIWCTYGTGIPTEIGYHYTSTSSDLSDNTAMKIVTDLHEEKGQVVNGVILDDGDGTVPLESLGAVCSSGWRIGSKLNPNGARVIVRELVHGENYSVLSRAGAAGGSSVDHVDIMGNRQVIRDVLQLAFGLDSEMEGPSTDSVIQKRNITL
jgi:phospholipid:diacylglycerol acyltransferase